MKPVIIPLALVVRQHAFIKESFYLVVIIKEVLESIVQKSHRDAIVADNTFSSVLEFLRPIVLFKHSSSAALFAIQAHLALIAIIALQAVRAFLFVNI